MLDEAAKTHPNSWWWLKGDGTDLVAGLSESVKMQWSGDVDLDDNKLQESYEEYMEELDFIHGLGLEDRKSLDVIVLDLVHIKGNLLRDIEFTQAGTYATYCVLYRSKMTVLGIFLLWLYIHNVIYSV